MRRLKGNSRRAQGLGPAAKLGGRLAAKKNGLVKLMFAIYANWAAFASPIWGITDKVSLIFLLNYKLIVRKRALCRHAVLHKVSKI